MLGELLPLPGMPFSRAVGAACFLTRSQLKRLLLSEAFPHPLN